MEALLISIVSIAIIIIGTMTMMMSSFKSASTVSDSWRQMEQEAGDIRRTEIVAEDAQDWSGVRNRLWVSNEGQTNLAQFPGWDVIAQYMKGDTDYLTHLEYTTDIGLPDQNQWAVEGIFLSDNVTSEIFDPDILNPEEKLKMVMRLDPTPLKEDPVRMTVSTPNGVTSQCLVIRQ